MDRHRFIIPALALLTIWRIALSPTFELSPQEALAVFYAEHPQLWHLEMGPLTPWIVKLTTGIMGHGELAVRISAPVLMLVACTCLWRLARGIFDATAAAWALLFLQVMPGFNLAAVSMTSATTGFAALMAYALALRIALHRVTALHGAWWCAAFSMALAVLADWRNALAWLASFAFFYFNPRRRHHLMRAGWWMITLGCSLPLLLLVGWNIQKGWPHWYGGEAEPIWSLAPNLLRWFLLVSPGLLTLTLWSLRQGWVPKQSPDQRLLFTLALPFLVLDLGWGPREAWPHAGWLFGWALAFTWLAQRTLEHVGVTTQKKILLRTVVVIMGGAMSLVLLRTDVIRHLGIYWPLQNNHAAVSPYRHLFKADPAADTMGWRQAAGMLRSVLSTLPVEQKAFLLAEKWDLAAELSYYLPKDISVWQPAGHPRVHCLQSLLPDHPYASFPRYDAKYTAESTYNDRMAIYITDSTTAEAPPVGLRERFASCEMLSVVNVIHGGYVVRTLKFFACHRYHPLDL
jgi:hypothetical protein